MCMTVFTKCFDFNFQIGINPGMYAAFKGHHYAGPGNHFCKYQMLWITSSLAKTKLSNEVSKILSDDNFNSDISAFLVYCLGQVAK